MALIEPGRKAPAFALKDQKGETHRLSDYAGQHVVLYFYPRDNTPVCTTQLPPSPTSM
jgi:peroxiredoxin Q/BCP